MFKGFASLFGLTGLLGPATSGYRPPRYQVPKPQRHRSKSARRIALVRKKRRRWIAELAQKLNSRKAQPFLPNFNGFHYKTWTGSREPALFLNRTPGYPVIKPDELALLSTLAITARVQSLRGL